ncbi:MAG TPA: hypothetical protein VFR37_21395 [Longimicrobium sp.]|nr:hypothetical protein [Longimicrobium sp.]
MKLNLDALAVESFPTEAPQAEAPAFAPTYPLRTCWPCEPTL